MKIELYHTPHTRSLRPRWLLEELEVPYILHPVDLFGGEGRSAAYRKINPLGSVPAVKIDGKPLLESGAICHWLTDCHPDRGLAPAPGDPHRARYEQWMFFVPGTLEPPAFDIVLHTLLLPEKRRIEAVVPFAQRRYHAVLKVLNEKLEENDYLLGERFTTADIMTGSTLLWLPEQLERYPALVAYSKRLTRRQAYQRANVNEPG